MRYTIRVVVHYGCGMRSGFLEKAALHHRDGIQADGIRQECVDQLSQRAYSIEMRFIALLSSSLAYWPRYNSELVVNELTRTSVGFEASYGRGIW